MQDCHTIVGRVRAFGNPILAQAKRRLPHGSASRSVKSRCLSRVAARCQFEAAARFEDVLQIEVQIVRLGEKSVTYAHRFFAGGQLVASGEITAVCCRIVPGQPPQPLSIPAEFADKLRPFVAS